MQYRRILKTPPSKNTVKLLKKEINLPEKLAVIAAQRGISNFEEARAFFAPKLTDLHDPFLMADMEKAANRLLNAVEAGEKILVYGDYDVDGTTSVSMMYTFLKLHHKNVEYYIPDRYGEGYGISDKGINYALEAGFSLMITLDCGIKAVEKIDRAQKGGLDVIVCDHHRPGAQVPPAFAVLDPKRDDCAYPFKELSGCGVGFKLIQAVCSINPQWTKITNPFDYLDLVSISTACDIVPVVGENRVLLYYGLQQINTKPKAFVRALLGDELLGKVNVSNLVFVAGPRINAAGRIEHAHRAVELLTTNDKDFLREMRNLINNHNDTRRELDQNITKEALEMVAQTGEELKSTVVYDPKWHKGVIGIVASRLIENYYKPTIVFTKSGEKLAGSARSVKDFDIYDALEACKEHLEQFGGHKYAAGMTLKEEQLEKFRQKFEEVVSAEIKPEQTTPAIEIDTPLDFDEIDFKFFRTQERMAPFGPGNPNPVYITERVVDAGFTKIVGKDESHLKVHLKQVNGGDETMSGIAFGMADHFEYIKNGNPVSIVYHLDENEFNGNVSLQLKIKDIQPA